MDRRDFLRTTGAAAAALAAVAPAAATPSGQSNTAVAAPHLGSGAIEVTFASAWPETFAGYSDHARRLARGIEQASGGLIRIANTFGESARADADIYFGSDADLAGTHPAFSVFAGLPGHLGLAPSDFGGWLAVAGGQLLWDDLAADLGVKPLAAGHSGVEPVLWSRRPIHSASDLSGQRVFVPGLAAELARGLGAIPTSLTYGEAAHAVLSGNVDVVEWGSLLHASADRIPDVLRYGILGGLTKGGTVQSLHVSRKLWDQLPGSTQMALAAAAATAYREAVAEARLHQDLVARALHQRYGVELRPAAIELRRPVDSISSALVAHLAAFDARARRIDASYMAYWRAVAGPTTGNVGV